MNHHPTFNNHLSRLSTNLVDISANFRKIGFSCLGKMIYERNLKSKISWYFPFNMVLNLRIEF